jgi:cytochrome c-type biogenesis protein CcmH/NrfF
MGTNGQSISQSDAQIMGDLPNNIFNMDVEESNPNSFILMNASDQLMLD